MRFGFIFSHRNHHVFNTNWILTYQRIKCYINARAVIILASTMGPAAGAFLGFVFGCTSVIGATMTPGITSFVFSPFITVGGISGNFFSLVIALVPRILLGVIAGYVFKFAKKYAKNTPVAAGIAAAVATVCHTIMVLGLIVILFGPQYSQALGISKLH